MSQSIEDLISIRTPGPNDVNFMLDSFIACLSAYTESIVSGMNKQDARQLLEKMALVALNRIDYSVFIASHKDDSDDIIAFIVGCPKQNHVFFQYTKYAYRKLGIQRHFLLPMVVDTAESITVNWPTKEMLKLVRAQRVSIVNKFVEDLLG